MIAFVEDVAASGGYMIACAADEIVADPSSIVGSIGVIGASFGFAKLIDKIGVERRIYTSGTNKAMLDPFLPENPEHVARLKAIQEDIHADFIDLVKSRRGAKLTGPEEDLFSGEYWAARKGMELGLIDRIGDMRSMLARALWRQGRDAAGRAEGEPVRPHDAGRECEHRRAARQAGAGRRADFSARSARDLGALRIVRRNAAADSWAIGAVGAALAGRWLYKESRRINAELHPEQQPANETEMGKLERDPKTGVYRPK